MGWLSFALSPAYRTRFKSNSLQAGYTAGAVRNAIGHAGKMVLELPRLWYGKPLPIQWDGLEQIEAAHTTNQGIIFLTPHLGCFEITAQAYAMQFASTSKQITVLYRPAKKAWMQNIVARSRNRPGLRAAPASLSGVKTLVKALRSGQALGILPDQVPPSGLGIWAPFFDKPAYTMTLPARLAHQTGATVLLAWGERLPAARGYLVHVRPLAKPLARDAVEAATQINAAMQSLIQECPEQYLWGYPRYKLPAGDPPMDRETK